MNCTRHWRERHTMDKAEDLDETANDGIEPINSEPELPTQSRIELVTRTLQCPLTDDELLKKGKLLSAKYREASRVESEKKSAMGQFKNRLDAIAAEVNDLSQVISEGCFWDKVPCHEVYDYTRGTFYVMRLDTGEVLSDTVRPLLEDERQIVIHGCDPPTEDDFPVSEEEDGDPDVDEDSDVDYDNAEEELENLDEYP